ncbi:hypothetical protein C5C07_19235 [Haloferax sp. Atlit-4N]|uniref:hypothetical protein n=1 Tax=Haloferax sp. Atlit-4N TaxID=2077206 RepID=UPI000E2563F2|nr:hypothetical protein [Haloferax sp. Atlit-4N]RDZ50457.1 hypothetical protein C5C07_19235 [Haloferax sp. Atlit-4N]
MTKISPEELISEVTTELTAYLRRGQVINQSVLADALDFTKTNIDDLDRLLDIHFALAPAVGEYTERLHQELRGIATTTTAETQRSRGDISGSVDWGLTTKARAESGFHDRSVFVTRRRETSYETPKNLVLKSLLGYLFELVENEIGAVHPTRRKQTWDDEAIQSFTRIYESNVHLERIPTVPLAHLTPRMIDAARQSREYLYYKAAELLDTHWKLHQLDVTDPAVRGLLEETVAAPDGATLFELYWIFKIVRRLRETYPELSIQHVTEGSKPVARLRGSTLEIDVYHTSQGNLTLTEPTDGPSTTPRNPYLTQQIRAHKLHQTIVDQQSTRPLFSGTPDIVVEFYDRDNETQERTLAKVVLGEVKYTDQRRTLSTGVFELLEYLMHAQYDGQYIADNPAIDLAGLVFSDCSASLQSHPLVASVTPQTLYEQAVEDQLSM